MPLLIDQDDAVVANSSDLTDAPAVRITGARVHFSNSGTLRSSYDGTAAVVLTGHDAYLFNAPTGIIRSQRYPYPYGDAITGSPGADTIVNEGRIDDDVDLGGGNDSFTQRSATQLDRVLFGDGDDMLRIEAQSSSAMFAYGGPGWDRLVIGAKVTSIYEAVDGFEQLVLEGSFANLSDFNGYQAMTFAAGGAYNFLNSKNPVLDLTLDGMRVTVGNRSSFRNITGGEGVDGVEVADAQVGDGGQILGNVDLAGGNDHFSFQWTYSRASPLVAGTVQGGTGDDRLFLVATGGRTIDLTRFSGFESINSGYGTSIAVDMRILGANGFTSIIALPGSKLALAESSSPDGNLILQPKSAAVIEATTTLFQVSGGGMTFGGAPSRLPADEARAVSMINNGTVLGDVFLSLGSDLYDGSAGTVGGTVYGVAGNDTIRMGTGNDHADGGFGADNLQGGVGADTLVGGDGDDVLMGEGGEDILFGGGGDDRLEGGDDFDQLDGGTGSDVLYGGAGDDVIDDDDEAGGAGNDQMFGEDGWDSMSINRRGLSAPTSVLLDGGGGPDVITFSDQTAWLNSATLIGGEGDDHISAFRGNTLTIDAGIGNDRVSLNFLGATTTVTLGAGRDFLALAAFDGAPPGGGSITVTDFETGDLGDRLELLTYLVQRLDGWDPESNPFATQHLRLVQDVADTLLQLDSDGTGATDTFATLLRLQNVAVANLTIYNLGGYAGDGSPPELTRITGTPGLDQLWGTGGMDIIQGLGSQDEIFGGAGDDWIEGGDGKDLLYGQYGDDRVFGESGVDNLIDDEGGDDQLFGGDHTDYIVVLRRNPTALSNVLLDGGEGDDFLDFSALYRTDRATLLGGNGNDSLKLAGNGEMIAEGGAGNDHFEVNYSNGHAILTLGAGADDVMVGGEFGFGVYLQVTINDFAAGDGGDRIDLSNYLSQRTGWDGVTNPFSAGYLKLRQSGADTLLRIDLDGAEPGAATTLITLRNVEGQSLTSFNLGFAPGNVEGAPIKGGESDDYLVGTVVGETISGFGGNDNLIGGGGGDYLVGGAGADLLSGNADAPSTLQGGVGDDWYYVFGAGDSIVEFAGEGNDRIITAASYTLSAGREIETLTTADQAGTAAINLSGNAFGQVMFGNAGANVLTGGGGVDYLLGLGGNDMIVGNADAASTLQGGTGDDWYYVFQTGDSLVEFAGEGNDRILTTVSYTLSTGQEIETLSAATPSGNTELNLTGNGFAQFIQGTGGANILSGDGGSDQLSGLGGSDILLGGDGEDFLNGGTGSDVLNGGAGADVLVFADALGLGNIDGIQDFATGSDRIALDHNVFTGLANGVLSAGAFVTGTSAQDADDRILYDSATGQLWFDADGNGSGGAVHFATLSGHPPIAASDFVVI